MKVISAKQTIGLMSQSLRTMEVGRCMVKSTTTAIVLDLSMGDIDSGQEIYLSLFHPETGEGMAFLFDPETGVLVDTNANELIVGIIDPLETPAWPVKVRMGVEVERLSNGVLHPHVRIGQERLLCPSMMDTHVKELVAVVGSTYQTDGEIMPASVIEANLSSWD